MRKFKREEMEKEDEEEKVLVGIDVGRTRSRKDEEIRERM